MFWGFVHFSVTADDLTFTDAVKADWVTARTLYFVQPTGVSEANWTEVGALKTALMNYSDSSGDYIELQIPKGAFAGKKWLKMKAEQNHTNCREIELLTVKSPSFCIRIQ